MRYHALASDYDGTLATNGRVGDDVRAGLERLRSTGRKIILVTGRRLDDLATVCPDLSTFDVVVAFCAFITKAEAHNIPITATAIFFI